MDKTVIVGLLAVVIASGCIDNLESNLDNLDSDTQENLCEEELTDFFDRNKDDFSESVEETFTGEEIETRHDFMIESIDVEHWTLGAETHFNCREGRDEGENVNYEYCDVALGTGMVEYERIQDGVIEEEEAYWIDEVVFDDNGDFEKLSCKEDPLAVR